MSLSILYIEPIAPEVKQHVNRALKVVKTFILLNHEIQVVVTPSYVVGSEQEGYGFAAFVFHDEDDLLIYAAGHPLPLADGMTFDDWAPEFRACIYHEFTHYIQWRDGQPLREDEAEEQARRLLKRDMEAHGQT